MGLSVFQGVEDATTQKRSRPETVTYLGDGASIELSNFSVPSEFSFSLLDRVTGLPLSALVFLVISECYVASSLVLSSSLSVLSLSLNG